MIYTFSAVRTVPAQLSMSSTRVTNKGTKLQFESRHRLTSHWLTESPGYETPRFETSDLDEALREAGAEASLTRTI